ncbi:MAG: hypothetical protein KC680_01570 [Candidatus Peregrinibacteria bacterium]|nr:hypothetical protein [Candidatus Peregrinibacteria bacterium]MCB9807961.1 hypothetical protein [Candidatus Peribacteria bacterium]
MEKPPLHETGSVGYTAGDLSKLKEFYARQNPEYMAESAAITEELMEEDRNKYQGIFLE